MIYLAEVYWDREFQLQQQGFDFTYDKRLLDRLHHGNPHEARGHLQADPAYSAKLARFLENHDEARSVARVRPSHPRRRGADLHAARAALLLRRPVRRARHVRAPVQLGRWPADPDRPDIRDLYARLLQAIDKPLFHDGDWSLLDVRGAGDDTNSDLLALRLAQGRRISPSSSPTSPSHEAAGLVQIGDLPEGTPSS